MMPSKKKPPRRDLSPDDKRKIADLCELWVDIVSYRRALQDRVKAWQGDLSGVADVFGPESDVEATHFYGGQFRAQYLAQAQKDLARFDRRLLMHTGRFEPPDWLCEWFGYWKRRFPEGHIDRRHILRRLDSLEIASSDNTSPGALSSMTRRMVGTIEKFLPPRQSPTDPLFLEGKLSNVATFLSDIATYCKERGKGSPDSRFVDPLFQVCKDAARNKERVSKLKEIIASPEVTRLVCVNDKELDKDKKWTKAEIKAGRPGRRKMAARIVVGKILGVSESTIDTWIRGRRGK